MPTLLAVGVLVSIMASLAHELLGHGTACVIEGGRITLLTFLVFRCDGAGVLTDGGGPVGALVMGCLALLALRAVPARLITLRVWLFTLGTLGLLWVCGQTIAEAIDGSDDWGHVATDLAWPGVWHAIVGAMGLAVYVLVLRIAGRIAAPLAGGRPWRLLLPYLGAVMSAMVLGALWHGDRLGSALDGLLSFGLAPIGYLLVIRRMPALPATDAAVRPNLPLLLFTGATWLAFALTIARGIGPLA
ncbi:hypothetical protein [Dyella sp. C9]|uniref:hypothetical protein n=1 Tax=Dyella sp. C9 TaxID=2202154 RepID=UPI0013008E1C|nr:hypothetical protein [Dyella sp. C9]